MDAEQLDEKFEATEYATNGNLIPGAMAPVAEKKKRVTVAGLKKDIDDLRSDIEKDVLDWLGNLDTRLESLEATTAKHNDTLLSDVKTRLDTLERFRTEDLPTVQTHTTERIKAMEAAIGALADAFRSYIAEPAAQLQPAAAEIGFAKPPAEPSRHEVQEADLSAVAAVCLNMNDVLMITRALADAKHLRTMDKNGILSTACKAAGIQVTHGLQIRAGVFANEA